MLNKMVNVEVNVQLIQMEVAVKKLVESIITDSNIILGDQADLWVIFEQLSLESFTLLKKNVYFSDLLKSLCISVLPSEDLCRVATAVNLDTNHSDSRVTSNENNPKNTESGERATSNLDSAQLPALHTRLDDLILPDRFLKLVKRLRNASLSHENFNLGETLDDLVNLSTSEVSSLPGIGASYVETLKELKLLVQTGSTEILVADDNIDFITSHISNMRLILAGVDVKFNKALEKYAKHIGAEDLSDSLDEILKLARKDLIELPGFGNLIVDSLIEFRDLIKKEISLIAAGEINYEDFESRLIAPKVLHHISISKIEEILLEDIDIFLDHLLDEELDIIQKRWGFVENKYTLEEIASDFNLTRERIRQKESKINKRFLQNLRISQKSIWLRLKPELTPDINLKLKNLLSCFSSEKDFYEFLNLICNQNNIYKYVYPDIDKTILNTYFAENGAPIHIDDAQEYLKGLNLGEHINLGNAIRNLAKQGVLCVEGENIWPKQLGKAEASACILINHEKGLPWLDIAKLVNANGYSKTEIYEDRLDQEAFNLPDFIFLAGKGIYKHTSFINELISLEDVFNELKKYTELNKKDVFHLNECYLASSYLKKFDYYEIRYFVKNFGEDYDFYFNGRSQSDSVSLERYFKNITQRNVIVEAMNRSLKPLTKPEVANLLKSKSIGHAGFYLEQMLADGTVVQVERMLYTTPTLAYKDIDINIYINAIDEILQEFSKPVEPSIFKEKLNLRFSKSYSKYFYASIARLYCEKKGWYRKKGLYSINEIPFNSLKAVLDISCGIDKSINENIAAVENYVAITRETCARALMNWKNTL